MAFMLSYIFYAHSSPWPTFDAFCFSSSSFYVFQFFLFCLYTKIPIYFYGVSEENSSAFPVLWKFRTVPKKWTLFFWTFLCFFLVIFWNFAKVFLNLWSHCEENPFSVGNFFSNAFFIYFISSLFYLFDILFFFDFSEEFFFIINFKFLSVILNEMNIIKMSELRKWIIF